MGAQLLGRKVPAEDGIAVPIEVSPDLLLAHVINSPLPVPRAAPPQRYASNGLAIGGEFQVNTGVTFGDQLYPSVAKDAAGTFMVVWQDGCLGCFNRDARIRAQLYASDGLSIGGEFQFNTYTTMYQQRPAVAADAGHGFVVVWDSGFYSSPGPDGSAYGIQAQRYAPDGSPIGDEFQVNTYTTSYQTWPAAAKGGRQGFIVIWQSNGSNGADTSGFSIHGQSYEIPVLIDGFEDGTLGGWSSVYPPGSAGNVE